MNIQEQIDKLRKNGTVREQNLRIIAWITDYYNSAINSDDISDRFKNNAIIYSELLKISDYEDDMELNTAFINVIIVIITLSDVDKNCSFFKNYLKLLETTSPELYEKSTNVAEYLIELRKDLWKEEIFDAPSLSEVGRIIYERAKRQFDCDDNVIKISIQRLNVYPFNKRKKPITVEDYYNEIVAFYEIYQAPQVIYEKALILYLQVQDEYTKLIDRIGKLETNCERLIQESKDRAKKIKNKRKQSIINDFRGDRNHLLKEIQLRTELEALHKKSTPDVNDYEAQTYLEYCKAILQKHFSFFIHDTIHENEVQDKIKQWVLRDASQIPNEDDLVYNANRVEENFNPFIRALEEFNELICDDPFIINRRLKLKIKSAPFINAITDRHRSKSSAYKLRDNKSTEYTELVEEIKAHPLYVEKMLAVNKGNDYLEQLKLVINDAISMIRNNIERSLCFKSRMRILEKVLLQMEMKNYEVVINMIPSQIEGLFADFLNCSLLYSSQLNISLYEQIYTSVLKDKTKMVITNDLNLGIETIGYFNFYFKSVYRDTVAHGNYNLLFNGEKGFEDLSEEQSTEIIAYELILDLCYMVDIITRSNELDEAKRYLTYTKNSLQENDTSITNHNCADKDSSEQPIQTTYQMDMRYERLLLDLLGEPHFNYGNYQRGVFVRTDPIQLLFWIFNPLIEEKVGLKLCEPIRKVLVSEDFWRYVEYNLKNNRIRYYDLMSLRKAVRNMMCVFEQESNVKSITQNILRKIAEYSN